MQLKVRERLLFTYHLGQEWSFVPSDYLHLSNLNCSDDCKTKVIIYIAAVIIVKSYLC